MHARSIYALAALAAVCSAASSITSLNAKQSERILSAWSVYSATVAYDKSVASIVDGVYTAVPSTDVAKAAATATSVDLVSYLNNPPKVTTPSWYSVLPSSLATPYMALQTSVENALVSLGREAVTGVVSQSTSSGASTVATLSSGASALVIAQTLATATVSVTTTATSTAAASASSASAASAAAYTGAAPAPTSNGVYKIAGVAVGAVGAAALFM